MNQSVVIKSNKYGITVILDNEIPYTQLIRDMQKKFEQSAHFFKNAQMAVAFEGRELSDEEEKELVGIISTYSDIEVICIIDKDKNKEKIFQQSLKQEVQYSEEQSGNFYKGTLRSGQLLEAETSIVILGDVNPGANVVSTGNIIVLGSLKGTVYAGGNGNADAFVAALDMDPIQIRIGDFIARGSEKSDKKNSRKRRKSTEPQIAYVEDGGIYIESITKEVLQDMPF